MSAAMFTGLVEAVGVLRRKQRRGPGYELWIEAPFSGFELGESIAVCGACLTVTRFDSSQPGRSAGFAADVSQETVDKTSLGQLSVGSAVNLERSLQLGGRLGGHLVSGHVDGLATLERRTSAGDSVSHVFSAPVELMPFIAPKGSVTLDGVSLTVNRLTSDAQGFEVMLIPHTLQVTTLGQLKLGGAVNLEVDLLARYVVRYLTATSAVDGATLGAATAEGSSHAPQDQRLLAALAKSGFKL